jgi:hypothetical protein
MRLKASEKAKLLRGEFPELHRTALDFTVGEEIVLKTTKTHAGTIPEVSIRVLERHKTKNGSWQAIYVVKDDRGLYVNQGLGYTRSPTRALDREAPILDPAVIEKYAAEAEQKSALLGAERTLEQRVEAKEARVGKSRRSERAIARHSRSLAAKTSSEGGIIPSSPAGPADAAISSGG